MKKHVFFFTQCFCRSFEALHGQHLLKFFPDDLSGLDPGVKALRSHSQNEGHQGINHCFFKKKKGETASKGNIEQEILEVTVQR